MFVSFFPVSPFPLFTIIFHKISISLTKFCIYTAGGHLSITEAFQTLEEHMGKLQPDPADCGTPPLDPWYDGLITPASGKCRVEKSRAE